MSPNGRATCTREGLLRGVRGGLIARHEGQRAGGTHLQFTRREVGSAVVQIPPDHALVQGADGAQILAVDVCGAVRAVVEPDLLARDGGGETLLCEDVGQAVQDSVVVVGAPPPRVR